MHAFCFWNVILLKCFVIYSPLIRGLIRRSATFHDSSYFVVIGEAGSNPYIRTQTKIAPKCSKHDCLSASLFPHELSHRWRGLHRAVLSLKVCCCCQSGCNTVTKLPIASCLSTVAAIGCAKILFTLSQHLPCKASMSLRLCTSVAQKAKHRENSSVHKSLRCQ